MSKLRNMRRKTYKKKIKKTLRKKRKTRKRKSRSKKGGSECRTFNNNCSSCVNTNSPQCVFNSTTKECSKQTPRKRLNRSWSRNCDINDLPLADEVIPQAKVLREESEGGTPYVRGLSEVREGSKDVPPVLEPVDAGKSLEQKESEKQQRINNLKRNNGTINSNSPEYDGTACFTSCKHKGWCESGIKGLCDRENYCFPSNENGDDKLDNVEKQYCDVPSDIARAREEQAKENRAAVGMAAAGATALALRLAAERMQTGNWTGGRKSRKRRSRKRRSRKRKSRKRKSRKRKSRKRR